MLNFTKSQHISFTKTNEMFKENNIKKTSKHFPNSTREWKNSIYLYNKNNLNLIPRTDLTCIKVIKSYFSLFNKDLDYKLRNKNFPNKFRKRSLNKILVSNGEFKHTNNKVTINLYLFNRQANNYDMAMQILEGKMKTIFEGTSNKLNIIEKYCFKFLIAKKSKSIKIKKLFLINNLKENIFSKTISNYINICIKNFFIKLLNKQYDKILQYYLYKQMLFINKSKYSHSYIQYLKQQIFKIYNKRIEFNLINIKRFYLNSDILSESILKRISKKRKKVLIFLKSIKQKILVLRKNTYLHKHIIKKNLNKKINFSESHKALIKDITKKLKHKDVTGFRLEARGRLTKRYTASRSILKVAHKGNLLNIDSSIKGLSSVLLKGNLKSSLQYSKMASKSRIGSFGIKGWVSSN